LGPLTQPTHFAYLAVTCSTGLHSSLDIREEDLVKAFVVWISCAASRNTDLSG
jgi:hypothetical protein